MNTMTNDFSKRSFMMATLVATILASPLTVFAGPGKGKDKDKDDFPKFDEVVKDMEVSEGFFTLYYDKKKDTVLARIPKSLLSDPFLISVSIPKGPGFASSMVAGGAVYWERMDKKLVLMEAETRFRDGKGSTVEDVINRTYTDSIIRALDIKTEAPGGDPVIDLDDLLKRDLIGLGDAYGGRNMDASLSRWSTRKAFPDNVELAVDAALMSRGAEDGIIAAQHISCSKLPKDNGYEPRDADDRIGFFLTVQKDWTADHSDKTVFKRYCNRWHLEKQDPKADESPVKDPIVFYIEKTVPVKFRRYVREGILEWNKAYEKLGLLNAVQVRQQTDTNEFKDLDPEDVRYNFFRWIVTGRGFARGPSRVNPFTGQILDADIVFDDSMARFYVHEFDLLGPRAYGNFNDPVVEEFHQRNPEFERTSWLSELTPNFMEGRHLHGLTEEEWTRPTSDRILGFQDEHPCEMGEGMIHHLAIAQLATAQIASVKNGSRDLPEEFIGQIIREIVMHEVGHTLGLRHNFKASSWLSLSEIVSASSEDRPLVGSVMDYNPAEFSETEIEQGTFVTNTLGPYDMWAIEYGYRPFMSGSDHKSESEMLAAIASRAAEPGLDYATDEDTSDFGPDPYVYRYDNGDDPIKYAKYRMEMAKRLQKDLADYAVEDGESYYRLRRAFGILLGEYGFAARIAARTVGGQRVHRDHKGDPNARDPFVILPADQQREAVEFLGRSCFAADPYQFSTDLLNKLGAGRFLHWDSDQMTFDIDYNVHDRVLSIQARVLTMLMNPFTLNRMYDAEIKVPDDQDAYTVAELFQTVSNTIWSELDKADARGVWTNRQPRISSFRRNLQREHLRRLTNMFLAPPNRGAYADINGLVRMNLKDLGEKIGDVLEASKTRLDPYTLAHLDEAKARIDKALDAEFTDGASPSARSGGILFGMETVESR
jgi:hypothetical protein